MKAQIIATTNNRKVACHTQSAINSSTRKKVGRYASLEFFKQKNPGHLHDPESDCLSPLKITATLIVRVTIQA